MITLEKGILIGLALILAGVALLTRSVLLWREAGFGMLSSTEENLRQVIPSATMIVLGVQTVFSSFFMSALGLKTSSRRPPATD